MTHAFKWCGYEIRNEGRKDDHAYRVFFDGKLCYVPAAFTVTQIKLNIIRHLEEQKIWMIDNLESVENKIVEVRDTMASEVKASMPTMFKSTKLRRFIRHIDLGTPIAIRKGSRHER